MANHAWFLGALGACQARIALAVSVRVQTLALAMQGGALGRRHAAVSATNLSLTAGVMLAHAKAGNTNSKQSYLAGVGGLGC